MPHDPLPVAVPQHPRGDGGAHLRLRFRPNRGPLSGAEPSRPRLPRVLRRPARLLAEERGAVTAEYAIVIMAAVAFAGLLVAIMRSEEIRAMLVQLVEDALGAAG
ncbi:DUF4244 domain-containing protein [Leucobacter allii]|uniref:DUF4244 domain-containing protein n=1 Tax=Leucobacter allii TaxID=2932247 RepID=UPI001FD4F537|nr:DUF4244 domain-containing protein [Leucobacter allii]UOR00964.1 DUF4244 domain-containing protein [Leucobacter allii]